AFVYSTALGGSQFDEARSVALTHSSAGEELAILVGGTFSADFPLKSPSSLPPFQGFRGGLTDAFAAELLPSAAGPASLRYSTLIGGSGFDDALAVDADSLGNAFIAGGTQSADFPIVSLPGQPSFGPTPRGGSDGFAMKLNAD